MAPASGGRRWGLRAGGPAVAGRSCARSVRISFVASTSSLACCSYRRPPRIKAVRRGIESLRHFCRCVTAFDNPSNRLVLELECKSVTAHTPSS